MQKLEVDGYLSDVPTQISNSSSEISQDLIKSANALSLERNFRDRYNILKQAFEARLNQLYETISEACSKIISDEIIKQMSNDVTSVGFLPAHVCEVFETMLKSEQEAYIIRLVKSNSSLEIENKKCKSLIRSQQDKITSLNTDVSKGKRAELSLSTALEKVEVLERNLKDCLKKSELDVNDLQTKNKSLIALIEEQKNKLNTFEQQLAMSKNQCEILSKENEEYMSSLQNLENSFEQSTREITQLENVEKKFSVHVENLKHQVSVLTSERNDLIVQNSDLRAKQQVFENDIQRLRSIIDDKEREEESTREHVQQLMVKVDQLLADESRESNDALHAMNEKMKSLKHSMSLELAKERRLCSGFQEELLAIRSFREDQSREVKSLHQELEELRMKLKQEQDKLISSQLAHQKATQERDQLKMQMNSLEASEHSLKEKLKEMERMKDAEFRLIKEKARLDTERSIELDKSHLDSRQMVYRIHYENELNKLQSSLRDSLVAETSVDRSIEQVYFQGKQELQQERTQWESLMDNYKSRLMEANDNIEKLKLIVFEKKSTVESQQETINSLRKAIMEISTPSTAESVSMKATKLSDASHTRHRYTHPSEHYSRDLSEYDDEEDEDEIANSNYEDYDDDYDNDDDRMNVYRSRNGKESFASKTRKVNSFGSREKSSKSKSHHEEPSFSKSGLTGSGEGLSLLLKSSSSPSVSSSFPSLHPERKDRASTTTTRDPDPGTGTGSGNMDTSLRFSRALQDLEGCKRRIEDLEHEKENLLVELHDCQKNAMEDHQRDSEALMAMTEKFQSLVQMHRQMKTDHLQQQQELEERHQHFQQQKDQELLDSQSSWMRAKKEGMVSHESGDDDRDYPGHNQGLMLAASQEKLLDLERKLQNSQEKLLQAQNQVKNLELALQSKSIEYRNLQRQLLHWKDKIEGQILPLKHSLSKLRQDAQILGPHVDIELQKMASQLKLHFQKVFLKSQELEHRHHSQIKQEWIRYQDQERLQVENQYQQRIVALEKALQEQQENNGIISSSSFVSNGPNLSSLSASLMVEALGLVRGLVEGLESESIGSKDVWKRWESWIPDFLPFTSSSMVERKNEVKKELIAALVEWKSQNTKHWELEMEQLRSTRLAVSDESRQNNGSSLNHSHSNDDWSKSMNLKTRKIKGRSDKFDRDQHEEIEPVEYEGYPEDLDGVSSISLSQEEEIGRDRLSSGGSSHAPRRYRYEDNELTPMEGSSSSNRPLLSNISRSVQEGSRYQDPLSTSLDRSSSYPRPSMNDSFHHSQSQSHSRSHAREEESTMWAELSKLENQSQLLSLQDEIEDLQSQHSLEIEKLRAEANLAESRLRSQFEEERSQQRAQELKKIAVLESQMYEEQSKRLLLQTKLAEMKKKVEDSVQ